MTKILSADRLPDFIKHGLGWQPDLPDYRDWRLKVPVGVALPSRVSLRANQSPVRDQGALGSCVGMAVAAGVEYLRRTDADLFSTIYSPLFVYYNARAMHGWEKEDTGAYIRDGVKTVVKLGIAPDSAWPYRIDRFTRKPHATAHKKADRWKLGSYHRCDMVTDIKAALAKGYPVVGGFSCYENMFTWDVYQSGIIPMPSGGQYGGHAVLFVGYDDATNRFTFKNSWGTEWGDEGYGTLPYDYVSQRLAGDFWAMAQESEESFRGLAPGTPGT